MGIFQSKNFKYTPVPRGNIIEALNADELKYLLTFLEIDDICRCARVSKQTYQLIEDQSTWEILLRQRYPHTWKKVKATSSNINFKSEFQRRYQFQFKWTSHEIPFYPHSRYNSNLPSGNSLFFLDEENKNRVIVFTKSLLQCCDLENFTFVEIWRGNTNSLLSVCQKDSELWALLTNQELFIYNLKDFSQYKIIQFNYELHAFHGFFQDKPIISSWKAQTDDVIVLNNSFDQFQSRIDSENGIIYLSLSEPTSESETDDDPFPNGEFRDFIISSLKNQKTMNFDLNEMMGWNDTNWFFPFILERNMAIFFGNQKIWKLILKENEKTKSMPLQECESIYCTTQKGDRVILLQSLFGEKKLTLLDLY